MRRALGVAMAIGLVTGCAANRRPPASPAAILESRAVVNAADRRLRDTVMARLVRRVAARGDRTLDVLLLSGGGQNGAFGAGFLRGWASRPEGAMPRFDLVTGVSTGALQAPYALLGTPAALDTIRALYARAATTIAPRFDWLVLFRRTGGLVTTARYDRVLERTINGDFRAQLRQAFAEDRQLLFTTTDFDLGIGRFWSLGDELEQQAPGADGLVRTRTLLKAATAIPGIFPPVMVDGHLHADGGVVENVAPLFNDADYQALADRLQARGLATASQPVTVRLWVVMNNWSHAPVRVVPASNRGVISGRSTALLFYLHQATTLDALPALARAVIGTVPGLRLDVHIALLPNALGMAPGADALFDRAFMARLDSAGFAKARSSIPWDVAPSAYIRPEPL
jgi:hypothetical protein